MRNQPLATWLSVLTRVSAELGRGRISALDWQDEVERLFATAPMKQLHDHIQLPRIAEHLCSMDLGSKGEAFLDIPGPGNSEPVSTGATESAGALITKVAYVARGRSIPPHGHLNMASAFLCLSGEFHVRLFHRVEDREHAMIIEQTANDPSARKGAWSSVSDYRNNIHWLTAESDDCFLFAAKVNRIKRREAFQSRIYLDLHGAQCEAGKALLVPKITPHEAFHRY